jgi:hypothetical protein
MNIYKKHWDKKTKYPHHLRNVVHMDANEFVDMIHNASDRKAKELVNSVNAGDAYILKDAICEDRIEDIKNKIFNWSKDIPSKAYKMLDDCPDYHCINNQPQGPTGGYTTIEHSYVFFRHNKNDFSSSLFETFDKYWGAIKMLSGNDPDAFSNNIPSDGIIDRMAFLQYPYNCGKISKHFDSGKIQKLLLGCLMSQIGKDYSHGPQGFYVTDKKNRKYFLENISKKGDFICVSPTLYHGVPNVFDKKKDVNWDSLDGRWYAALYSPESHEVSNRDFTVAIKE